jgi:hypothetical protein
MVTESHEHHKYQGLHELGCQEDRGDLTRWVITQGFNPVITCFWAEANLEVV